MRIEDGGGKKDFHHFGSRGEEEEDRFAKFSWGRSGCDEKGRDSILQSIFNRRSKLEPTMSNDGSSSVPFLQYISIFPDFFKKNQELPFSVGDCSPPFLSVIITERRREGGEFELLCCCFASIPSCRYDSWVSYKLVLRTNTSRNFVFPENYAENRRAFLHE